VKSRYAFLLALVAVALVSLGYTLYRTVLARKFEIDSVFVQISVIVLFVFLVLLVIRYLVLIWFSYLDQIEDEELPDLRRPPRVTVIVPCFNEGAVVQASIRSLLDLDYPNYEILVVDDGSTDDTYEKASALAGKRGRVTVRVITKPNGGKARALNTGIKNATGEIVLCMDGDSKLTRETLMEGVKHFIVDKTIGAVAGNVKVINRENVLTKLQALEYIEGLNMARKAQGFFRMVNIIPGPIGLFRKSALLEVGLYDHDTYAEDCDLTLKLLMAGHKVRYERRCVALTEAPEDLLDLLKQRYRWTRGILQAVKKHSRLLWNPSLAPANSFILWYMVFEGMIWPAMNIFANVFFVLIGLKYGLTELLVFWWAQLTLLDVAAAIYCLAIEEEDLRLSMYAVFYRLFFILIIDVCKVMATVEELSGRQMSWGKLERKGRL
jgi:poly-beta-1,6 N-acetyl-D-glucosamine synthase